MWPCGSMEMVSMCRSTGLQSWSDNDRDCHFAFTVPYKESKLYLIHEVGHWIILTLNPVLKHNNGTVKMGPLSSPYLEPVKVCCIVQLEEVVLFAGHSVASSLCNVPVLNRTRTPPPGHQHFKLHLQ